MNAIAPIPKGYITYHENFDQGSDEWLQARCGLLTASEMKLIVTPTLKLANNEKTRAHVYELLAQRINKYVEPTYIGDEMLRGHMDEVEARILYERHYAPTTNVGFITNDRHGFTIGCSPDALVGADGGIEAKSRRQKFQVETIIDIHTLGSIPADFVAQVQTCLLVTERKWWDFLSYSGGMPLAVCRVFSDPDVQAVLIDAAAAFEARVAEKLSEYQAALAGMEKLIPTERRIEQEMFV